MAPLETRTKILDVAARLFHEQGYHATGISTILREAGVNSGSLYHYFAGKEGLLVGVLDRYLEILRPVLLEPVEAENEPGVERVFALLAVYRRGLELTECSMGCPIGNLALELADNHAEIRDRIDRNFESWIDAVAGWIDGERDRLPADLDTRELARFVLTTMEGGLMQARAASSLEPFDASVRQLRRYFDLLLSS